MDPLDRVAFGVLKSGARRNVMSGETLGAAWALHQSEEEWSESEGPSSLPSAFGCFTARKRLLWAGPEKWAARSRIDAFTF
jgi:hypothetical protein